MRDADERTLSTHEVAELARVSYRQLDHWVGSGFLVIADAAPGSGTRRHWSPDEAHRAHVFAELVHAGVTPQAAAEAMPSLLLGTTRFVVDVGLLTVIGRLT
jgi:hypothetical protein